MLRTVSMSVCFFLTIVLSGPANAVPVEVLLYGVDFENPPHVVGQGPTIGLGPAPRVTPSSLWFGEALIADGIAALPGQVVVFDQPGIQLVLFGVGAGDDGFFIQFPIYRFEADILIGHLEPDSTFKVFADLPTADSVSFEADGSTVKAIVLGEGGSTTVIGTFTEGTLLSLQIEVDRSTEEWTIWLDGVLAHQDAVDTGQMRIFRLAADGLSWPLSFVAVDNVKIYGIHFEGDCNDNGIPDENELASGGPDCDGNGVLDVCDVGSEDSDIDGVPLECDNCPDHPNSSQRDADGDGAGDECDPCPLEDPDDADGDGVCAPLDPCPFETPDDADGDGVCAPEDQCPFDENKTDPGDCGCGIDDLDSDGDGTLDCTEQCPGIDDTTFVPGCIDAIPTISSWGMIILTLLLLTASKVVFTRRMTA